MLTQSALSNLELQRAFRPYGTGVYTVAEGRPHELVGCQVEGQTLGFLRNSRWKLGLSWYWYYLNLVDIDIGIDIIPKQTHFSNSYHLIPKFHSGTFLWLWLHPKRFAAKAMKESGGEGDDSEAVEVRLGGILQRPCWDEVLSITSFLRYLQEGGTNSFNWFNYRSIYHYPPQKPIYINSKPTYLSKGPLWGYIYQHTSVNVCCHRGTGIFRGSRLWWWGAQIGGWMVYHWLILVKPMVNNSIINNG